MTPKVSKVLADASVNTSEVDQAIQRRSGMPTKINGLIEQATPAIPVESAAAPVAPEVQPQDSLNAEQNAAPVESQPTTIATDANRS